MGGTPGLLDMFEDLADAPTQQAFDVQTQEVAQSGGQFYGRGEVRTETMLVNVAITNKAKVFCRRTLTRIRRWQNLPHNTGAAGVEQTTDTREVWMAFRMEIS